MHRLIIVIAAILVPTSALAHTGAGSPSGLAYGFLHPLGGLDHVLAMVAVGILAFTAGGRALWLVPAAFVGMMVLGGAAAMGGIPVPFVELGIGLSIVAIGAAATVGCSVPLGAAMGLVGVFAVFHGHAHGTEMPATASGIDYGLGFVLATASLHAAGLAAAWTAGRFGTIAVRAGGGAVALAGGAVLVGLI